MIASAYKYGSRRYDRMDCPFYFSGYDRRYRQAREMAVQLPVSVLICRLATALAHGRVAEEWWGVIDALADELARR